MYKPSYIGSPIQQKNNKMIIFVLQVVPRKSFEILKRSYEASKSMQYRFGTYTLIICSFFLGHFIPSRSPMDSKVSDRNDNLVCYVYKYKNNFLSQLLARTDQYVRYLHSKLTILGQKQANQASSKLHNFFIHDHYHF